ncbi:uncharacterized protein si:dkey-197j19.6 isoform X2 [Myxocyprinus asiaticus]|uniref:uncharacterized protein si:dkey-197j19.6 isoform X2 n=1 Tax=Myxocyprinus asiaticus TaxID=70543 RepID=UPI002222244C|nr:uncharacterized protein si:dkey-197j19.6 isoform X2 [Myxocyprinus asiaticus]
MSRLLSPLLSTRENGFLCSLLSHDCSILACGVVQLVIADPPQKKEWKSHSFGIVCLVQDKTLHSTFMRLYCLKKAKLVWEQELYTPFEYSEACPYFHTFPGDECRTGLNFADEEEAKQFYIAVQKQISDNKAHSVLTRSHSVGSVSEWKDKLDNCLRGSAMHKRNTSKMLHRSDSKATLPESSPTVASTSQFFDSPQTPCSANEDSISLAQRKGPLPPIPPHARAGMVKVNHSGGEEISDSTFPIPSLVPSPPSYPAPKAPPSSAGIKKSASFAPVKDVSPAGMKRFQSFYFNADKEDESGFDDYL